MVVFVPFETSMSLALIRTFTAPVYCTCVRLTLLYYVVMHATYNNNIGCIMAVYFI